MEETLALMFLHKHIHVCDQLRDSGLPGNLPLTKVKSHCVLSSDGSQFLSLGNYHLFLDW